MAYRASSGPGVDFLSSFREMAAHDCASYEEMWRANSRKGSHLPPVFSSAKSPLHISSLHSAFWFAVFSLRGCACICVFYPTFPIFDAKPIAAVERKGSEASLPGPNLRTACHQLCGPGFDFVICTLSMSVAPALWCWED